MWLLFISYIENLDLTEGRGEHAQGFPEVTPQRVRESSLSPSPHLDIRPRPFAGRDEHLTVLHNPLMNLLPSGRKEEKEPGPSPRQWKPQH